MANSTLQKNFVFKCKYVNICIHLLKMNFHLWKTKMLLDEIAGFGEICKQFIKQFNSTVLHKYAFIYMHKVMSPNFIPD